MTICRTNGDGGSQLTHKSRKWTTRGKASSRRDGKIDVEPRALPLAALHPDLPAMGGHDSLHHGKTQAGAAARPLGGEERLEDAGQYFLGHAATAIGHRNADI